MVNAFVTSLPQGLARLARPEAEIRAEAAERGLTGEQADAESTATTTSRRTR